MTLGPEGWRFARGCRVALFATRSPGGAPFATPLWFVERKGSLYCTTSGDSVTVRNVEADGEAALLLYPGAPGGDARALRLTGRAMVLRGRLPLAVLTAMARKYFAAPGALATELGHVRLWPLRLRYYNQSAPALLAFTPAAAEWVQVAP